MKTTIDIADALLKNSRTVAARDHTTLEALVHEGLRRILAERSGRRESYRLRDIPRRVGGFQPEFADGDWQRIRDATYRGRGP